MPIRDNSTGTVYHSCAECEKGLDLSQARVQDDQTGRIYCGARCHHLAFYGAGPALTMSDEAAWARVLDWERRHLEGLG